MMNMRAKAAVKVATLGLAMMAVAPAAAQTSILISPLLSTAPGAVPACTGTAGGLVDRLCANTNFIGRDFGTTTDFTALITQEAGANWVRFGSGGGGEMSISNGQTSFYTFTPAAGFEIRMLGFTHRKRTATGGLVPTYDLVDLGTNTSVWSLTTASAPTSHTAIAVNSGWFANALRFAWSNEGGGSLGIRALSLEMRAVAAPPPVGGVPEPQSWAMLIAGFGLTGLMARRRRQRGFGALGAPGAKAVPK